MKFAKRTLFKLALVFFVLIVLGGSALYGGIQLDAHRKAGQILSENPQAKTLAEALISEMQSESNSVRQRNMAVWVAGRLRVSETLPVMQENYYGGTCDHEHCLCQYELKKAILRCGGEL